MDVKDALSSLFQAGTVSATKGSLVSRLSVGKVKVTSDSDSTVSAVTKQITRTSKSTAQEAVNGVISAINTASDAATKISEIAKSIDGIVQVAGDPKTSNARKQTLQKEATDLFSAIKQTLSSDAGKSLNGDKITAEVEKELGKRLEVILPEVKSPDPSQVSFSSKDAIIQIQSSVARLKAQIDDVQKAVRESRSVVQETLNVALQNQASSESSLQDVTAAANLVGKTSLKITDDPSKALDASPVNPESLQLLST